MHVMRLVDYITYKASTKFLSDHGIVRSTLQFPIRISFSNIRKNLVKDSKKIIAVHRACEANNYLSKKLESIKKKIKVTKLKSY